CEQQLHDGAGCTRGELPHFARKLGACAKAEPEPLATCSQPLQVALEQTWVTARAGDGLEQTITVMQPTIEHRNCSAWLPDRLPVDEDPLQVLHQRGPSSAARSPRALARVSSSSRSGSESATMPAPARKERSQPRSVMVRIRILRSRRPSRVRYPSEPV